MHKKTGLEFLKDFLKVAPSSHALWRSVEALSFSNEKIKEPVLDLGCGFGEFSGVVYGKLECGVDINKSDLKIALSGKKYRKVVNADARKMPFPDKQFSTVISVSVLEHITNTQKVFQETNRVLKRGGLFIFSVPTPELYRDLFMPKLLNKLGLNFLGKLYIKIHKSVFKHVTIKSLAWWKERLTSSNFKIVNTHGTISKKLVVIHELLLIFALPSQIIRWVFGKRIIFFKGLNNKLGLFFAKNVVTDNNSLANVFIVAQKR